MLTLHKIVTMSPTISIARDMFFSLFVLRTSVFINLPPSGQRCPEVVDKRIVQKRGTLARFKTWKTCFYPGAILAKQDKTKTFVQTCSRSASSSQSGKKWLFTRTLKTKTILSISESWPIIWWQWQLLGSNFVSIIKHLTSLKQSLFLLYSLEQLFKQLTLHYSQ